MTARADDDDELGEDAAFVHALVRRVRDEQPGVEPSDLVTARLLAAAKREARRGLWTRVAAHPGLAAAATLAIVAGATAIWMNHGGKVAEPTEHASSRPGPEKASPPAPAATPGGFGSASAAGSASASGAGGAGASGSGSAAPPVQATPPAPATPPVIERDTQSTPPPAHHGNARTRGAKTPAEEKEVAPTGHAGDEAQPGTGEGGVGGLAQEQGPTTDKNAAHVETKPTDTRKQGTSTSTETETPDTVADQPNETTTVTGGREPAPEDAEKKKKKEQPTAGEQARQLTRQARTAAKKGACAVVKQLADKVKKLDAQFYASDFASDADIKRCL